MAKGYWISCYRSISDPEALAAYAKLAAPAIQAAGGRFIVRGTPVKTYEHGLNQRIVVVETDIAGRPRFVVRRRDDAGDLSAPSDPARGAWRPPLLRLQHAGRLPAYFDSSLDGGNALMMPILTSAAAVRHPPPKIP